VYAEALEQAALIEDEPMIDLLIESSAEVAGTELRDEREDEESEGDGDPPEIGNATYGYPI